MKIPILLFFFACCANCFSQLKLDSLISVSSIATEPRVEIEFSVENLTDSVYNFYWYLELEDPHPEGWEYEVIDRAIVYHLVDTSFHTPCDINFINTLEPKETWSLYSVSCYPNGKAGTQSLKFYLTEKCGDLSESIACMNIEIDLKSSTQVTQTVGDIDISLYPNPAKNSSRLQIENYNLENAQLILFDSSGQEISSYKVDNKTTILDFNAIKSGIYLWKLIDLTADFPFIISTGKVVKI